MHGYLACGGHGSVAARGISCSLDVPCDDWQERLWGLAGAVEYAELRYRDTLLPFIVPRVLLIPFVAVVHSKLLVQQQGL